MIEGLGDDTAWAELEQKMAEYHAFGVDVVWVVDARMEAVRVHPRAAAPFVVQAAGERTSPWPAGFTCVVRELFEQ